VADRDQLESLSSEELHDRATQHALRHGNVKFFWNLLQSLPAAEAGVGEIGEARDDIQSLYGRLDDLKDSGQGAVADALRPLYLDYLEKHS
jgi:hypothetical protein